MIATTFATLAGVGYTKCAHPRCAVMKTALACLDCGAAKTNIIPWTGGSLSFHRAPLAIR